mmetsp:Transcript_2598/g.5839  ORF Transcript_2598/g.5839 Transcript_2598/m.5839 type:complete len:159 (+) Transcript_2598:94-570(+)|eukprot:CAMPEP_0201123738 /NCGR_PEP_ID=MMETSP0850-20130426/9061_1 /ASSEMBLY_ACC=CAM_ASM_000622 /TAXON_ID=183588 /ORGANISM="Pseudo-nitzschia fraudulenta, Strain WWA7" /LENGTH=158 /DNA_ID=CAMNT_0047390805 /DNA_START=80 /DNA_END=556 /DNA_ORIENTATION=+
MKNFLLLFIVAVATLFTTSPTLVGAESCSSGEGECANPDAPVETEEAGTETASAPAIEEDPNCPSRELIIRCAGKHLDLNKNGKLDRSELQGVIDDLPWYARSILQILGSVDKMMKKCDVDGDDAISMDYDMIHNKDNCLASCFKRRAFKNSFFPDCE